MKTARNTMRMKVCCNLHISFKYMLAFSDYCTTMVGCVCTGLSPGACMISNQSMPFIQSDAFAIQSQTDQVVLTGHDCWPGDYMYETEEQEYMHMWHQNMTNAVMGLTKKAITTSSKAGYFTAACYTHGDFTHSYPLIDGLSYNAAFSKFYMDEKAADQRDVQWADECGEMCNPTCP